MYLQHILPYCGPEDRPVEAARGHQVCAGSGEWQAEQGAHVSAGLQVAVPMGKALLEFVWALRFHVDT